MGRLDRLEDAFDRLEDAFCDPPRGPVFEQTLDEFGAGLERLEVAVGRLERLERLFSQARLERLEVVERRLEWLRHVFVEQRRSGGGGDDGWCDAEDDDEFLDDDQLLHEARQGHLHQL